MNAALSNRLVATRPQLNELIEELEEILRSDLAPLTHRRIQHALALLHASGDALEEASLLERYARA